MRALLIISLLLSFNADANESASEFFLNEAKAKQRVYRFNPYETIFSGVIAFVIGNVGFYSTKSSILKLGYSGVQTIGIMNVGRGIYEVNSPSIEGELYRLLNSNTGNAISKEVLSVKLIKIFAKEERAKRTALFYGSSFLTVQYLMNSFVGKTEPELKKIYLFMSGVNLIVAAHSAFSKSNYEKKVYGPEFNIEPIFAGSDTETIGGLQLSYSF